MEDYIVIILTIIILIVGAVGRNKRKNIEQPANDEPAVSDNLWGLMDELGLQPTQQQIETIEEQVEIIRDPYENPSYDFTAKEEGASAFKNKEQKKAAQSDKIKKEENIKSERFSLRKAVIYSEILNRKYT
jgi:uncharacterized protein YneF (UPF0154 family)